MTQHSNPTNPTSQCHEKHHMSGVHFHERPVNESCLAMPSNPPAKRSRIGTGIWFNNREVESCCIHPLQAYEGENVMEPVPCPVGQPLYAPPVLATTIITTDESMQDAESTTSSAGDGPKVVPSKDLKNKVPFKFPSSSKDWPQASAITLKDCSAKYLEGVARDYRLSSDELTFVEAAVQMSKGVPQSSAFSTKPGLTMLAKPSLAAFGRFEL